VHQGLQVLLNDFTVLSNMQSNAFIHMRSDRQERVLEQDVVVENKVAAFNWRMTSNSG